MESAIREPAKSRPAATGRGRLLAPAHRPFAALTLLASVALTACAAPPPPSFGAPIVCDPGVNCWVSTFFDHDAGPGHTDHTCGPLSNDEHHGVGFAIANLVAMEDGVPVIAAAGGTVVGTRNRMPDVSIKDADPALVEGRECGNGVRIDHGDGWATQYCHLKRGSVLVRTGQEVAAGDALGQVGLSGNTDHPHVFLAVFKDGEKVDPYTGVGVAGQACGKPGRSLWNAETAQAFPYRTGLIRDAFFTHGVPDSRDVKAGTVARETGPTDLPELALWVKTIGTVSGYRISMTIRLPGGLNLVSKTIPDPKNYALVGIRARKPDIDWLPGTYSGAIRIIDSENRITDSRTVRIELR